MKIIKKLEWQLFIRQFKKDATYYLINVLGLSIGIICVFLICLWLNYETGFDGSFSDTDRISRVTCFRPDGEKDVLSPINMASTLEENFPQVESAAYVLPAVYEVQVSTSNQRFNCYQHDVHGDFFKVFDFKTLEGTLDDFNTKPAQVVISERLAKKLFADASPLGKEVFLGWPFSESYSVCAVVDVPQNAHIQPDFITWQEHDADGVAVASGGRNPFAITYVKFKEGVDQQAFVKEQLTPLVEKNYAEMGMTFDLQPLEDIHLYTNFVDRSVSNSGSLMVVRIMMGVLLLIVVLTIFNFINLSMARAENRFKEMALKKVFGTNKMTLIREFFNAAMLQLILAVLLSSLLIYLFLPSFLEVIDIPQRDIQVGVKYALIFVGILILIPFLSSLYIGLYLYRQEPVAILRGRILGNGKTGFRKMVFYTQMVISISLLIFAFVFRSQLNYVHEQDLGVNVERVMQIRSGSMLFSYDQIRNELLTNPDIIAVSGGFEAPDNLKTSVHEMEVNQQSVELSKTVFFMPVSQGFEKTFDLEMAEGAFISEDNSMERTYSKEMQENPYLNEIVLNEAAVKFLNLENPIGTKIKMDYRMAGKVIGVVKDFHYRPLKDPISPLVMIYSPGEFWNFFIRVAEGREKETIAYIDQVTKEFRKGEPLNYSFVTEKFDGQYKTEANLLFMTRVFALLAILLSLMGFVGILLHTINKRTFEIGVRKVLGANTSNIAILFVKDSMKLLIAAFVLAAIVGYYFGNYWLNSYAYHTSLQWEDFVFPFIILTIPIVLISTLMVFAKARQPVVETLKAD